MLRTIAGRHLLAWKCRLRKAQGGNGAVRGGNGQRGRRGSAGIGEPYVGRFRQRAHRGVAGRVAQNNRDVAQAVLVISGDTSKSLAGHDWRAIRLPTRQLKGHSFASMLLTDVFEESGPLRAGNPLSGREKFGDLSALLNHVLPPCASPGRSQFPECQQPSAV